MPDELTNLLPIERQNLLRRNYILNFIATALIFATSLVIVAIVLLLPTYAYLLRAINVAQTRVANMSATETARGSLFSAQLSVLTDNAGRLTELQTIPTASSALTEILNIAHPSVELTSFTYNPGNAQNPRTLVITGTANTRNDLNNYQLALEGDALVQNATLPVGTYASDGAPFTMTLTLTPSSP